MNRILFILTVLATFVIVPAANAANCLVFRSLTARVDQYNVMTVKLNGFLRSNVDRGLYGTAQTYRAGTLVYQDPFDTITGPGKFDVEVTEQLPLTWRGVSLSTTITVRSACGKLVRSVKFTTNPKPLA